ncbi:MAG: hypothetical protein IJU76_05940, partial [Desulfovibrionaceae bacterium]|nr:hypothetical protein [Desulfovibrionaceae bacterium]
FYRSRKADSQGRVAAKRPLDGRRCKVEKGVRCGAEKLRRFRRAGFSAEAPRRNKGKMPNRGWPTGNATACL